MFKPDPMPVDVIKLALGAVDELPGGMTELIGFWRPRVYVAQSIGDLRLNLSKRRTKYCRKSLVQAC
jgi:hypothetical protein